MDALDDLYGVLEKEVPKEENKEVADTTEQSATSTTPTNTTASTNSNGSFNPWEDEITPREINKTNLKRFDRNFIVTSFGEVPDEVKERVKSVLPAINEVGFTLRASGDTRDKLSMVIEELYARKEYHIPFKKFNPDVTAKTYKPTKYAYEIAAKYHRAFKKVPNAVRGFLARNVHLVLGGECDSPINFLIIYTSCGIETTKGIKFETAGNTSFFIDLAEELNIPIFNFKNEGSVERLKSFLDTFNK